VSECLERYAISNSKAKTPPTRTSREPCGRCATWCQMIIHYLENQAQEWLMTLDWVTWFRGGEDYLLIPLLDAYVSIFGPQYARSKQTHALRQVSIRSLFHSNMKMSLLRYPESIVFVSLRRCRQTIQTISTLNGLDLICFIPKLKLRTISGDSTLSWTATLCINEPCLSLHPKYI